MYMLLYNGVGCGAMCIDELNDNEIQMFISVYKIFLEEIDKSGSIDDLKKSMTEKLQIFQNYLDN